MPAATTPPVHPSTVRSLVDGSPRAIGFSVGTGPAVLSDFQPGTRDPADAARIAASAHIRNLRGYEKALRRNHSAVGHYSWSGEDTEWIRGFWEDRVPKSLVEILAPLCYTNSFTFAEAGNDHWVDEMVDRGRFYELGVALIEPVPRSLDDEWHSEGITDFRKEYGVRPSVLDVVLVMEEYGRGFPFRQSQGELKEALDPNAELDFGGFLAWHKSESGWFSILDELEISDGFRWNEDQMIRRFAAIAELEDPNLEATIAELAGDEYALWNKLGNDTVALQAEADKGNLEAPQILAWVLATNNDVAGLRRERNAGNSEHASHLLLLREYRDT